MAILPYNVVTSVGGNPASPPSGNVPGGGGSALTPTSIKTAAYTVQPGEIGVGNPDSGVFAFTNAAPTTDGQMFEFKNVGSNVTMPVNLTLPLNKPGGVTTFNLLPGEEKTLMYVAANGTLLSVAGTPSGQFAKASAPTFLAKAVPVASYVQSTQNPWTQRPMRAGLSWQPATAVLTGSIRVSGGKRYVAIGGTLTTTTTANMPTGVTGAVITETSGPQWTYYGPNTRANDMLTTFVTYAPATAYTLGQISNVGGSVYAVVTAGTSGAASAPTGQGNAIVDGTVTWNYLGAFRTPVDNDFPIVTFGSTNPGTTSNIYYSANFGKFSAIRALPNAGGSGYVVGELITITATGTAPVLRVESVNSGAITSVSVNVVGSMVALPATQNHTQASTTGSGTGATFNIAFTDPYWCRMNGAYIAGNVSNNGAYLLSFQQAPNTQSTVGKWGQEFVTDSPLVTLTINTAALRGCLYIDGVRYADDLAGGTTFSNFWTLDFTSLGLGRKERHFRFESNNGTASLGVSVAAGYQVWKPQYNSRLRAAVISDSIWAGSGFGPYGGGKSTSLRLGWELGWDIWDFSIGGTGYIAVGSFTNYLFRVAELLKTSPDIVILAGTTNDIGQTQAAETAAFLAVVNALRNGGFTGPIIVIGVWSTSTPALVTEDYIAAAVVSAADPKMYFVPVYRDESAPWICGSYNNNPLPNGAINAQINTFLQYVNQTDMLHPIDLGTDYYAERIGMAIQQVVLPALR